jgi:hypothetical protein
MGPRSRRRSPKDETPDLPPALAVRAPRKNEDVIAFWGPDRGRHSRAERGGLGGEIEAAGVLRKPFDLDQVDAVVARIFRVRDSGGGHPTG